MKKFFENKLTFVAIASLFTSALAWNLAHGSDVLPDSHVLPTPAVEVAHGPVMPPPDSTTGGVRVAHGPVMLPPDSTTGGVRVAHGPVMPPPDSTTGGVRVAHGPVMPPPDSTSGTQIAA